MSDAEWTPLLEGELGMRAREAIEAIAVVLAEHPIDAMKEPGLSGGAAGSAVFWAYLARAAVAAGDHAKAERAEAQAEEALDGAFDAVAEIPLEASLFGGFTGIAWTVEHLCGSPGEDDANEDADALLCTHLKTSPAESSSDPLDASHTVPWPHHFDLVSGLVGYGIYGLERLAHRRTPEINECLRRVILHLETLAQERSDGLCWHTPLRLLPPNQQKDAPDGYDNLGVAHGVPGVVALLSGVLRVGIETEKTRALLDGAVRWVLAQDTPDGFPAWVGPGITPKPTRVAWCYGDPGIAASLLLAARAAGEPAWEQAAVAIARRAATKPIETSGVIDAGLCHGAAGVGHCFARIANATGDASLADAARAYFRRALALRKPGQGIAGFAAFNPKPRTNDFEWEADPGLLCGAAGIGLALLAATSPIPPAWDRFLLLSLH